MSERLASAQIAEQRAADRVRDFEQQVAEASNAVAESERQCQALEELNEKLQRSVNDLTSHQSSSQQELDSALADKAAARDRVADLNADITDLKGELESASARLRDVKRQNADLEMKNLQLVKTQKQLEDDNAGLYIGLEAKQQELELVC